MARKKKEHCTIAPRVIMARLLFSKAARGRARARVEGCIDPSRASRLRTLRLRTRKSDRVCGNYSVDGRVIHKRGDENIFPDEYGKVFEGFFTLVARGGWK